MCFALSFTVLYLSQGTRAAFGRLTAQDQTWSISAWRVLAESFTPACYPHCRSCLEPSILRRTRRGASARGGRWRRASPQPLASVTTSSASCAAESSEPAAAPSGACNQPSWQPRAPVSTSRGCGPNVYSHEPARGREESCLLPGRVLSFCGIMCASIRAAGCNHQVCKGAMACIQEAIKLCVLDGRKRTCRKRGQRSATHLAAAGHNPPASSRC